MFLPRCLMMIGLSLAWSALSTAEPYVWWEGEAPSAHSQDLSTNHPFDAKHSSLSGGVSFGCNKSSPSTWVEYEVEVPRAANYAFMVRKFWQHGPFRFRWDNSSWQELENRRLLDSVQLNQHVINWQPAGYFDLSAGKHTLRIEATESYGPFVLDCFLLTSVPFLPQGTLRPGQKTGLAEAGNWAFEPDLDTFEQTDAIGLADLNEDVAGARGWVSMTKDGNYVDGAGKPIRFWCVNTNEHRSSDMNLLRLHAKGLAKRGINMWRQHGHINPGPNDDPMRTVNEEDIAALQRGVAVFKQEGLYCTFSPYWASHYIQVGTSWGIEGVAGAPLGTIFWEPKLQAAYKFWLKEALTRPNPYEANKTPLIKDPALAIFQVQNEDSLLFWTAQSIKGRELQRLEERYHQWREKVGLSGKPALKIELWGLENADQNRKDAMRFFAELMYEWNTEISRYMREDLGYKGLINAGNWKTADQARLLDLERYSYTATDIIGNNRYVNGGAGSGAHVNPKEPNKAGYQVNVGDYFQDISTLLEPSRLATNARQVAGHAYIIPESSWVSPMSYQSEGPFLVAAYSALNGIDGYYWFAAQGVGFDPSIVKWQVGNPSIMGGWPAAALMFRRGYLQQGKPAYEEERSLKSLWNLDPSPLVEEAGFDLNRDAGAYNAGGSSSVDPLAYLVGPAVVRYGNKDSVASHDLAKYIDRSAQTVTSNTREITLDYGRGIALINAAKAQGASGFLEKRGTIKLKDMTITSQDPYVTILAVSVDDKPLASSGRILLQITTSCRPYGWKESDQQRYSVKREQFTGKRVDAVGGAPWNVRRTNNLQVSIANSALGSAVVLDANLYETERKAQTSKNGKDFVIQVPDDVMYLLLTR